MIDKTDVAEFKSTLLTGVTVGVGSQILVFANGANIMIQCPFICGSEGQMTQGHGEDPASAVILFDFLNGQVKDVLLEEEGSLLLKFGGQKFLRIIPEDNGLESYVVSTRLGVCPVMLA